MTPVSYYAPGEFSSPRVAFAFARGCDGALMEPDFRLEDGLYEGPVAAFGSPPLWPLFAEARRQQRDWYFADHGYFGRGRYFRVTKNAYQHDGTGEATPDRFRRFKRDVAPWKKSGGPILVCPNSAVYFGLHGIDAEVWLRTTLETLRQHTDREIIVRWKNTPSPIQAHLDEAWAVVVFSSAAALDALIAGVPAFVLAPFAAGARMGLSDLSKIESPAYPDDREPFLWALADNQWTLAEMIDGHAWKALQARPSGFAPSIEAGKPEVAATSPVVTQEDPAAAPAPAPRQRRPRARKPAEVSHA